MLISEMHLLFKILMNKVDSLNYPNLEPEEIDIILNNEMFKIIEQRAYGTNPKRLSVEETQKRVDDLRNITLNYAVTPQAISTNNKPFGVFVALPTDYRHALNEECLINYTDCNNQTATKRIPVMPITHDRYNKVINDPFNKSYDELVNNVPTLELLGDGTFTITRYFLRYLRTPISMQYGSTYSTPTTDVNCELAEHLHREIVESAVKSTLENVESPRYPANAQSFRETE
jgi:hypothetical protein